MEQSQINKLRELAVNAISGHLSVTADNVHDLGEEIESLCDEVERLQGLEDAANEFTKKVDELQ